MRDEIFDREYEAGRAELNAGIDRAIAGIARSVGDSFKLLHDVQWNAPWHGKAKRRAGRA
jgi:hypothetical protein